MATASSTRLEARPRTVEGSRANRRLRRAGRVPGVLYGGGQDPVPFEVDARELRHALAASGAVLELALDGETATAVLKDSQHDPVRGDTLHVDMVRVRLDVAIHAMVVLELTGVEDAPGVREGGVLEQIVRELNVEALPGDIPEVISHDASGLEPAATLTLSELSAPEGVTLLDDPETVVATITAPRLEVASDEEIEQETERVGEAGGEESEEEGGVTADEAADEAASDVDTTSE